jgi:hypothetical protein
MPVCVCIETGGFSFLKKCSMKSEFYIQYCNYCAFHGGLSYEMWNIFSICVKIREDDLNGIMNKSYDKFNKSPLSRRIPASFR